MCGLGWLDGLLLYAVLFWIVWFALSGIRVGVERICTGRRGRGQRPRVRAIMAMLLPALGLTLLAVYAVACHYRVDQLPRETSEAWRPSATSDGASGQSSLPRRSLGR